LHNVKNLPAGISKEKESISNKQQILVMEGKKKYMVSIDLFDPSIKHLFDRLTGDEVSQKKLIEEARKEFIKQSNKNQTKLF